ncbi:MAG: cobyrinic acid a,c-diamide synthase [Betaproteobacteria bacterium RIFCSPLOWO2_12_FULL_62_13]|nr:MAG: cobyrinic acid a,c-diamide synthase [Betaproteobacteria bacterium RIFCSPLOWO2_12_FULL_62_13]
MAHLFISSAHRSSGKTTVTLGLCAALAVRGLRVQPFKKGPDYIDPMWLARAAGRPCRNLDFHLMSRNEIRASFARHGRAADIAVIEGTQGLHDGLELDGTNSNAALARLLGSPVILVIDARGMARGIAPLILGYQAFDRAIRIAGVILNNVGGPRHEQKLRAAIGHYTDVAVMGAVPFDARVSIVERHLGLVPSNESDAPEATIEAARSLVERHVDLDRLLASAREAAPFPECAAPELPERAHGGRPVRLGIARDEAFGFYYADDLDALQGAGAELVPVDTLHAPRLPQLDALMIGGGFPEARMRVLEANEGLRRDLKCAIEEGLPVYAECGGLMYLARSLTWRGETARMVGAIPADAVMHERAVGRGYARLVGTGAASWLPVRADAEVAAHEFHYSSLENVGAGLAYAFRVVRGHGVDSARDGIVYRNVLASYCHLRGAGPTGWARPFVEFADGRARRRRAEAMEAGIA